MPTFRVDVTFDYDVPVGTDPDEFHDMLREILEDGRCEFRTSYTLESVRDIGIEELMD